GPLIDAGDETVDRINNQHGDWRIENQIEDHARLYCNYAIAKHQGHITEEVLHVPTDIETDADAQTVTYQQKRVCRETCKGLFRQRLLANDRTLYQLGLVSIV